MEWVTEKARQGARIVAPGVATFPILTVHVFHICLGILEKIRFDKYVITYKMIL